MCALKLLYINISYGSTLVFKQWVGVRKFIAVDFS